MALFAEGLADRDDSVRRIIVLHGRRWRALFFGDSRQTKMQISNVLRDCSGRSTAMVWDGRWKASSNSPVAQV